MSTTTPTKDQVQAAADTIRSELSRELAAYSFVMFPEQLTESYGGWLLPGESRGSTAIHKSYDLHRLIEKIEDRFQDLLGTTVTIDLLPAAHRNGS
jgi:hypothetical protein